MTGELRDLGGRALRLLVALLIGLGAGTITVRLAATLRLGMDNTGARDWGLLWFGITAGTGWFAIALVVQNRLARRRWRSERFPRARVVN